MSRQAIESMIVESLEQIALEGLDTSTERSNNAFPSAFFAPKIDKREARPVKVPFSPNKSNLGLLTAHCSNSGCSVHIALNPNRVRLAGLSLTCRCCGSPLLLNKEKE